MIDEITHFVNWMRRRNPQAHTWRDYRCDLKQFVASVGDKSLKTVTFEDIDNFVITQAGRGLKPATINRHLAAVMSLYMFLSEEDPNLISPVLPHRHTIREPQRLPRPVPEGELKCFFQCINNERDQTIFLLMLRCGLRIAEVAGLRLPDLYLSEIPPRMLVSGKNSKERIVYLSNQVMQVLNSYLAKRPFATSDYVFLSYQLNGMSTTAIHKRLIKYREAAGVHFTAHQLRHTFANDLVTADVPVTTIQKLLGHSWLATTQTYVMANDRKVQADFYEAVAHLNGWQVQPEQDEQS